MRTPSRWLAVSSLVLLFVFALPARTRPHYGGTLRIEVRESNWQESDAVLPLVFECLTSAGPSGEALPALAMRWQAENGERRWIFGLRAGVLWHDGTPLTAEAVAASLERQIKGTALEGSTIRAAGETVVIESTRPMPEMPARLALRRFAIVRDLPQPANVGPAIGSGAFRVVNAAGNRVVLAANDAYWGGRPYLDTIEVGTGRAIREQWMDAGVHRIDVATVPAEMLRRAQQEGLRPVVSANSELIALVTTRSGAAMDVRVRQALAATVDRVALLNFAFQKQGEVALGLLPNRLTGYAALLAPGDAARLGPPPAASNPSTPNTGALGTPARPLVIIGYDPADSTMQLVAERIALNAREHAVSATASASGRADFMVVRTPLPSANLSNALNEFAAAVPPQQAKNGLTGDPVQTPVSIGSGEIEEVYRAEHELLLQANWIPLLCVPRAYSVADRVSGAAVDASGRLDLSGAWIEEPL